MGQSSNILDQFRLDGQVAVVTGGGRGIGEGIALGLAEAGADVVLAARRKDEIEAVAEKVRARGRRALAARRMSCKSIRCAHLRSEPSTKWDASLAG